MRDGRVVEDRRGGETALVVGRGGWLRLPAELLDQAGIGERARAAVLNGGVMLTGGGGPPAPEAPVPVGAFGGSQGWSPAAAQLRGAARSHGRRKVLDGLSLASRPGG